ncbi:MAG: glycosyltransferase family 2 protein [Chlorobi bacterium]|nr:glycosyltransferase family 2 protein [Chlorobiota bacterium]
MTKTAVVILNWNGVELLEQFLPSVIKYSNIEDAKIFVIDNNSTDNSVNFLQQKHPDIEIIKLDKNYGFAEGYNKGLQHITAEYYILLNSDIEVSSNWIEPVIELMDNNTQVAACMPKIRSYRNKRFFEHAGAAGGFIDRYGYPFCRGRILNIVEEDKAQYNNREEIFWATGACFFVRASLFAQFGGFDKDFFAHMEEIDLCWRFKNRGYKIMFEPQSVIYHVGGATLDYLNPHKTYLNFRNSLLMLYKNLSPKHFFQVFMIRMILDGIAALKFLLSMEFKNFFAVAKAHYSFYKMINNFISKRKELLKMNTIYNHKQINKKSIVYQFFIKKIHYYSDL